MKSAMFVLVILWSAVAVGQSETPYPSDWIGFVRDLDLSMMSPPCHNTAVPFESVILHLVIANPSAGAVSGWHTGSIEVVGGVAPMLTLVAGIDITPDLQLDVDIGMGVLALQPNDAGLVHIANLSFFVMSSSDIVPLFIHPQENPVGTSYSGPEDMSLIPLTGVYGDSSHLAYEVNEWCNPIPNESATWSTVKALYR